MREPTGRTGIAWHRAYLAVTATSAGLLGVAREGTGQLDGSSAVVAAGLVVAMFAVTSILHWYDTSRADRQREILLARNR